MTAMNPLFLPLQPSSQRGIALVTSLMFLVTLTLLGMAAMRGTILEERMAGNARDRDLAFQSAEAALRTAERELIPGAPLIEFSEDTARTPRIANATLHDYWQNTHDWDNGDSVELDWQPAGTSARPRYVIEELGVTSGSTGGLGIAALSNSGLYRLTARGVGRNNNTVVMLQAIYER